MATLINRFEVHKELIKMIDEAEEQLILISPYIKLHPEYKKALNKRIDDDRLKITVIFGKNAEDISKSIGFEDFDFFSRFPNVQIRYCERLHAKIFANDSNSLVTSMNLHKFSAEQNIEVGILCKFSLLNGLLDIANAFTENFFSKDSLDCQIMDFIEEIIKYSPRIYFEKTPVYEKGLLSKTYIRSDVTIDNQKFKRVANIEARLAYCIRTGKQIPFNIKKPYSAEAYESWVRYRNEEYKEKFCFFSGEPSNGETCFRRPILSKNWKKAKEVWKL